MRYVAVHWLLALITLFVVGSVNWLVLSNITDDTNYAVAMLALSVLVLSWFPFALAVHEAVGEHKVWLKRRRKTKRR